MPTLHPIVPKAHFFMYMMLLSSQTALKQSFTHVARLLEDFRAIRVFSGFVYFFIEM